jgi:hypothetical protein
VTLALKKNPRSAIVLASMEIRPHIAFTAFRALLPSASYFAYCTCIDGFDNFLCFFVDEIIKLKV